MASYSPSGEYLLVVNELSLIIFDTFIHEPVHILKTPPPNHVFESAIISPKETYILIFAKPALKKGTATTTVLLYDLALKT